MDAEQFNWGGCEVITLFKHHGADCPPEFMEVNDALGMIKKGTSKAAIGKTRAEKDKGKRDKLKLKTLPMIIFGGEFSGRRNADIIKPSGFMCIDFDGFHNEQTMRSEMAKIKGDHFTYSCFISPSGNGLKAVIKIPIVQNNEEFNNRFEAVAAYWKPKSKFWDHNNKGIVRTCFMSYDPNLYLNENSTLFIDIIIPELKPTFIPRHSEEITEYSEVFRLLTEERECKCLNFTEGSRNAATFFLAARCNDYSIPQMSAEGMILNYINGCGLPEKEVLTTVKSAYNQASKNKTYNKKKEKQQPKAAKQIQTTAPEISPTPENDEYNMFWEVGQRGGLKLNFYNTKMFLEENGFFRYEINTSNYMFVRITDNVVEEIDFIHIKDFILNYLETIGEIEVYNMVAENSKFKKEYINYLKPLKIDFIRDEEHKAFLFFKNCFIEVDKDTVKPKPYSELNGKIWKKQKLDRDFIELGLSDYDNCDVAKFSKLICNQVPDRLTAYMGSMGYLMHGFKTYEAAKAIIYNDEIISDDGEPMGRSGKGLTLKFINQMRACVTLPGKSFAFEKDTVLQRVNADTQVIFIDDVVKNFDFENLFNWITEGMTVRKLYSGEVWIPFEDAAKLALTTNYTIKGDNNSHDDRRFEIEVYPYFTPTNRPSDVLGRQVFTGWDSEEWNRFDNFMISCLRLYLMQGLVKPNYVNLKLKKLVNKTNSDFIDFAKENLTSGHTYEKIEVLKHFKNENGEDPFYRSTSFTPRRFYGWLRAYSDYNGWIYKEAGSGKKCICFLEKKDQEVKGAIKSLPF